MDEEVGDQVFLFGKHRGKMFSAVRRDHPEYEKWALNIDQPTGLLAQYVRYCNEQTQNELLIASLEAAESEYAASVAAAEAAAVAAAAGQRLQTLFGAQGPCSIVFACFSNSELLAYTAVSREWRVIVDTTDGEGRAAAIRLECARRRRRQPPWYVDLVAGDDAADGDSARPLMTVACAQKLALAYYRQHHGRVGHDCRVIVQRCNPVTCQQKVCCFPMCRHQTCATHGTGNAFIDDGDEELYFERYACDEEGCAKVYCEVHGTDRHSGCLVTCEVCTNYARAHVDMGAIDYAPRASLYCLDHIERCEGAKWRRSVAEEGTYEPDDDEDEDDVGSDDEGYYSDTDYGVNDGSLKWHCGFRCCGRCLHNHQCGDSMDYY